jgi:hypothetical protein
MYRMKRASCYAAVAVCSLLVTTGPSRQANGQAASTAASAALDFEFFKAKVEPIFLARRAGHARCVVCHTVNNAPFHLVPLASGSTGWNEAQSRQNFQLIQKVVVPGFEGSRLLVHPLAEQAGGDPHHGGGQQFQSQSDPEWQTLKAFVLGATHK